MTISNMTTSHSDRRNPVAQSMDTSAELEESCAALKRIPAEATGMTPSAAPGDGILPNVLYLTDLHPSDKFGSLEELVFTLALAFQERGRVFLPAFGAPLVLKARDAYEKAGLEAEYLDLYHFKFSTLRRLLHLIRHWRIQVIDWNFYAPINFYFLSLLLLAPAVRHYLTDHNSRIPRAAKSSNGVSSFVKKMLLNRYTKVLCISDFVFDDLNKQRWSNLARCRFFVNTSRFQPDPATRSRVRTALAANGRFVLLVAAHLIRWKGVDVAIRALAELPDSVILWIAGAGEELENLRQLSEEMAVANRVWFLGNQRNVETYMQAADCFLCTSLWEEAMGFVNLEALSCELPVMASRIGGIPEFVDDNETGLLFTPGESRELAGRVRYLMSNPEIHRRMAVNARQAALDRFSTDRRLPEYLQLYRLKVNA
jgi:glycosyltransferase involved in cell wall biosynthesis